MSNTVKAIAQTEKSTKALTAVAAGITKVLADFPAAVESHAQVVYEIEVAQNKLDLIHQETADTYRKRTAELNIQILENEDKVLEDLMFKRDYATITTDALLSLQDNLFDATQTNDKAVAIAVATAVKASKTEGDLALATAKSDHSIAVAQKDADIVAKSTQIEFMAKQIASLEKTISDERQARVEMAASAASQQGVVVNTSGK